jgi:hypothetical protein
MPTFAAYQIAVDSTHRDVRVVIVAGVLDRAAAEQVLRIVDAHAHLLADRRTDAKHVVVDLAGVTRFEPGGLETLDAGVPFGEQPGRLHLAGCAGHLLFLPLAVRDLLDGFSTFPTVDLAVAQLSASPAGLIGATPAPPPVKVILRASGVELTARPVDPAGATM